MKKNLGAAPMMFPQPVLIMCGMTKPITATAVMQLISHVCLNVLQMFWRNFPRKFSVLV